MLPVQGDEWVIDTGVLFRAHDQTVKADLDAQAFIQNVRLSHHIALDFQGHITAEYQRNLMQYIPFRLWWDAMWKLGKIVQRDGILDSRPRRHLIENLRFDADDLPFVAVASKGSSKFLVSVDSDYTPEVREYLSNQLGVTTYGISDALQRSSA